MRAARRAPVIAIACVAATVAAGLAGCITPPLEDTLAKVPASRELPIVLVHGYNFFARNDATQWATMIEQLPQWGWNGGLHVWAYYGCDAQSALASDGHGEHAMHHGGAGNHTSTCAGSNGAHTDDTPIEHLGYHLAWTLYDVYSSKGTCVNVVAHSMGGLITRHALGNVGSDGFPPFVCVRGVVTFGTPHLGHKSVCGGDYQSCVQMEPGSAFLASLAQKPQGVGGTRWTLIGSEGDNVVSVPSAHGMEADAKVSYLPADDINHAVGKNYMHAYWRRDMGSLFKDNDRPYYEADDRTAAVLYDNGPGPTLSMVAPWPVRWADLTLADGLPVAP